MLDHGARMHTQLNIQKLLMSTYTKTSASAPRRTDPSTISRGLHVWGVETARAYYRYWTLLLLSVIPHTCMHTHMHCCPYASSGGDMDRISA